MSIRPPHLAAYLISTSKMNNDQLTSSEKKDGMDYIEDNFSLTFLPIFFKFRAGITPFSNTFMRSRVISEHTDFEWWKSFTATHYNYISVKYNYAIQQLLTAVAYPLRILKGYFHRFHRLTQSYAIP